MFYAGPFPETSQSNTHVLLVTDYFTKWVEAVPLQKKDPFSVAKALATVFYRWAPLLLVILHPCSAMGCVAKIPKPSGCFPVRAGTLPSTGETTQCLSVVLYKVLGKSLLSSCYGLRRKRQKCFSECPRPELCPSSLQKL